MSILAIGSVMLLQQDKASGYAMLGVTLIIAFLILYYWDKGRFDSELSNAKSTEVKSGDISVITDSRLFRDPRALTDIIERVNLVHSRKSLPEPSGLVGDDMNPVPNSREAAEAEVKAINIEDVAQKRVLFRAVGQAEEPSDDVFIEVPNTHLSAP
ncbi:hypothetical protein ASE39_21780 [Acidovorax sp. Root267]|nr:hypothetical protein ASE39_21780 [Acidovorax sp. Root267]